MKKLTGLLTLLAITSISFAQIHSQWRGENRDGIYNETGLLTEWPENGPELLWSYEDLGDGHASAAVTETTIYTCGVIEGDGYVFAFNHSGDLLWKVNYGKEWTESWDGSKVTPIVEGENLYIYNSYGKIFCLNAKTGKIKWDVDTFAKYGGENIRWGVCENLAMDGDKLFVMPGGSESNIIALNKNDGSLIWQSPAKGEISAYNSPMVIEHNGRKIFTGQTASSIIGLDVETGNLLWSVDFPNKYSVHANTPLFHNGQLFFSSGYGKGSIMIELSEDGTSVTEKWRNEDFDNQMFGFVLIDGKIYGSGHSSKKWFCVDWETGKNIYSESLFKIGTIIAAEGLLYMYNQKGLVALVKPEKDHFNVISQFEIPLGSKQHWAHPVIANKRLYIRHGNALMVYNIAE